ncbi:MAG: filamentous hemagglutinin N-terminal domain-containing protein, partial [Rickettsiales bacterium]
MVRKTTPIYQNWRRMLYCTASAVLFCAPSAHANPEDGVVADGQAQIITSINAVDIHQQTDRVVIDWRSFDIAAGERTEFHQPSASAIALNRVHSSQASIINGALTANGNVVIINQNGVTFGKNAQVDVNGLVATSTDIENQRFMNDRTPHFNKPGAPTSIIINEGRITAKESGLVGFVAPHVENSGVIQARMGRVTLASGDTSTVDFYGDGLLEVAVSDAAQKQLVRNTGTLSADGGTITMTAAAGSKLLASAIEVEGTLRAQTVQQKNGTIVISGMGQHAVTGNVASNKGKSPTLSNITLQANLDVSGKTISEQGGKIVVTADNITLKNGTNINANGASGGGIVRVGGEYLGQGTTPVARNLTMESGSVIQASATTQGHGGEVILFSENTTRFDGIIRANAAGTGGNGGFVETSGKAFLHIDSGTVQAKATGGNAGNWLLDPADITITAATNSNITGATPFTATATGSQVSAATIVGVLNGNTNVTVQTTNDAFAGNGDIFVNSAINTTGTGALTLSAFRNIDVGAAITLNGGALTLRSNNTGGAGGGSIRTTAAITTNGGNVTMSGGAAAPTSATYNANGSVNVAATGYAQGINLANFYNGVSIGANINATGTAAGGNILINGRGENGTNASHGVEVTSGALSTNFAGTINISGIGQGTAGNG